MQTHSDTRSVIQSSLSLYVSIPDLIHAVIGLLMMVLCCWCQSALIALFFVFWEGLLCVEDPSFREANTAIKKRDVSQMATFHCSRRRDISSCFASCAVLDTCSIFFHRRGDRMAAWLLVVLHLVRGCLMAWGDCLHRLPPKKWSHHYFFNATLSSVSLATCNHDDLHSFWLLPSSASICFFCIDIIERKSPFW